MFGKGRHRKTAQGNTQGSSKGTVWRRNHCPQVFKSKILLAYTIQICVCSCTKMPVLLKRHWTRKEVGFPVAVGDH